jgi:CHAD domain-containing protein
MESFALAKTEELLGVAVAAICRAAESPDEEAVHKMRVSIRRLQQGLRLFRKFLRNKGVTSLRRQLKGIMDPAGELRNYDIALRLMRRSGQDAPEIKARRLGARQQLEQVLSAAGQPQLRERWCSELGMKAHEAVET